MKTKMSLLLFIYLLFLIIDRVSNISFQYKNFSEAKCNESDLTSFTLETTQFPKELFGSNLKLDFEEKINKTLYSFICRLEDNKLQELLENSKETEDVDLSCFSINETRFAESSTIDLIFTKALILGGDSVDLVPSGGNVGGGLSSNLQNCQKNKDYYSILENNKIFIRQASHYEYSQEEQKITFILTAFIVQNLPDNYTISFNIFDDFKKKYGYCISKQEIKASNDNIASVNFNCQIDSITKDIDDFLLESEFINPLFTFNKINAPKEIDNLISKGEAKDLSTEKMPPVFTPKLISFERSENNIIANIKGTFNEDIEGQYSFEISLISWQNLSCKLESVKKDIEAEFKCNVTFLEKRRNIFITGIDIFDTNKKIEEIFFFKSFTTFIPENIDLTDINDLPNISFRQVCNYEIDKDLNKIMFTIVAMSSEVLEKEISDNSFIFLYVDLIKGKEIIGEEVSCEAKEDVYPENGMQLQVEYDCYIDDIENPEEYTGLEITDSKDISGIPTKSELLNPAKVDELIKKGEIKNYTSEEFKNEEIPLLNATFINATGSEETGKFIIKGEFLSEYTSEKSIKFEIILVSGEIALCTIPKIKEGEKEIEIECVMQEELINRKIMIGQFAALDGYNEIFIMNKISTEAEVLVANGKEIEEEKMFDINLSFGQVNGFEAGENIIEFIFIGFISEELKRGEELNIIVNLIKGKELVEEEVICISQEDVKPEDGKQLPVQFDCKLENIEKAEEYTGLEIVESEEISGIPTEPKLLDQPK